jgi:hypothetical protein
MDGKKTKRLGRHKAGKEFAATEEARIGALLTKAGKLVRSEVSLEYRRVGPT